MTIWIGNNQVSLGSWWKGRQWLTISENFSPWKLHGATATSAKDHFEESLAPSPSPDWLWALLLHRVSGCSHPQSLSKRGVSLGLSWVGKLWPAPHVMHKESKTLLEVTPVYRGILYSAWEKTFCGSSHGVWLCLALSSLPSAQI